MRTSSSDLSNRTISRLFVALLFRLAGCRRTGVVSSMMRGTAWTLNSARKTAAGMFAVELLGTIESHEHHLSHVVSSGTDFKRSLNMLLRALRAAAHAGKR